MNFDEAISKILPKEKQVRAMPRKGQDNTREYLEELVTKALDTTLTELANLVGAEKLTQDEASEVYDALRGIVKYRKVGLTLVAVYPEFEQGELYIHSVAITLKDDSN